MTSASNHQRDIDTDLVRKTVDAIQASQRPPSGEHQAPPCKDHESRIVKLETKTEDHEKRLHQGDIGFVQIRADLHALTKAVNDAVDQMKVAAGVNWGHEVLRAVINWGVPVAIIVIVWGMVGSGAVVVKGHP